MEIQPCGTCRAPSLGLHEFTSTQMFWISPLRVSLNILVQALITDPTRTWIGSAFHLLVVPLSMTMNAYGFECLYESGGSECL